jgi:dTDP-4-dehydrorhamnose 3,5-epimerase
MPTTAIEPIQYQAKNFADERGWLRKLEPLANGLPAEVPGRFDDFYVSHSRRHVFRGFHLQRRPHLQWKFIRVISGSIASYMINLDSESDHFKAIYSFELGADDGSAVLCPPLHGNGFLALEDNTTIAVLAAGEFQPASELVISPPSVPGIDLPSDCTLSAKDSSGLDFNLITGTL